MGFLKRFFKNVFRDGQPHAAASSFENLSEDQLEAHMKIARYGDFLLTGAVRPSFDLQVVPTSGYRHDVYRDKETGVDIPVLMASASRERLFDVFLELLDPLGDEVDVVLETSHERSNRGHDDLYREHIDLPVLKSTLCDFEDMILDDGCTGIAVLNPSIPLEVQFDEHKLLIMYGQDLSHFESVLEQAGLSRLEEMRFITEAEHVHSSSDEMCRDFQQLRYRLGLDEGGEGEQFSWSEG
ncbi:MAG TPA: hypothetical protein VKU82_12790 [Planctomycetaceae bacterium]|nr:hypothetical protein [Planctomycetaceae bacterium]